jgi:maleate isomerase
MSELGMSEPAQGEISESTHVEIAELRALTDALLAATGASRTTVRLAVGDAPPTLLVAESLAVGVRSMRDGPQPSIMAAPTYVHLQEHREILVQHDCITDGPAPPPSLIADYGVRAQMLAPILDGERLVGTVSVHHQCTTRAWTLEEIGALTQAQAAVNDWYHRSIQLTADLRND